MSTPIRILPDITTPGTRPTTPKPREKRVTTSIMLSPTERARLGAAAAALGMSLGGYIRFRCVLKTEREGDR